MGIVYGSLGKEVFKEERSIILKADGCHSKMGMKSYVLNLQIWSRLVVLTKTRGVDHGGWRWGYL